MRLLIALVTVAFTSACSGTTATAPPPENAPGTGGSQRRVAISGDGTLVVSLPQDRTLTVWAPATEDVRAVLDSSATLVCCAIAGDGKTMVAGDSVGGVHLVEWFDDDDDGR